MRLFPLTGGLDACAFLFVTVCGRMNNQSNDRNGREWAVLLRATMARSCSTVFELARKHSVRPRPLSANTARVLFCSLIVGPLACRSCQELQAIRPSRGNPSSMPLHPRWPRQWEEQQPSYDAFVKLSAATGDPARPDRPGDDTESSPALNIDDILVNFPEDYVSLNYTGSPTSQDNRRLSPDYPAGPSNIGVRSAHGYRESTAAERYAVHRVDDTIYDGQYIAIREPGPSYCRSQRPPPYTALHIDRLDADLRSSVCPVNEHIASDTHPIFSARCHWSGSWPPILRGYAA